MTEARFHRDGDLWARDGADGFVMLWAPTLIVDRDSIAFAEALECETAVFVFLPGPAPAGLAATLEAYFTRGEKGLLPLFLWIADPTAGFDRWGATRIDVDRMAWRVMQPVDLDMRGYGIALRAGSGVVPDRETPGFVFNHADGAAGLRTPGGALTAATARLDFADAPGCWRLGFTVAKDGDAFDALDCRIRYFQSGAAGEVRSVASRPLRQPGDTSLDLIAWIDPLRPLTRTRSHITFVDPPTLDSGFVTRHGHDIGLQPLVSGSNAARLTFQGGTDAAIPLHLAPEGRFSVRSAQSGSAPVTLMCGSSALEYIAVPNGGDVLFVPHRPAWIDADHGALTGAATTAWIEADCDYFAQPDQANLFVSGDDLPGNALVPFETRAARLIAGGSGGFPSLPLRGVDAPFAARAKDLDRDSLGPVRRAVISDLLTRDAAPASADSGQGAATIAVTRLGLGVGVDAAGGWCWVGVGNPGAVGALPDLRFNNVRGPFRRAFQSAEPFMVLGNADVLAQGGSIPYRLDADALTRLRDDPALADITIPQHRALLAAFEARGFAPFADRAALDIALLATIPALTPDQRTVFARAAGQLRVTVEGWTFDLSPELWRAAAPSTYLLIKLTKGRSIADLSATPAHWAWPEAAARPGATTESVAKDIGGRIEAARAALNAGEAQYGAFVRIVEDPDWSGVLALGPTITANGADESDLLAAGLEGGAFTAHHLSFATTAIDFADGAPRFGTTPVAGLIDYRSDDPQYFAEATDFAFRVSRLTVAIEHSAVSSQSCTAQLLINRLFGSRCVVAPGDHGANITLTGSYQAQRGADGMMRGSFAFANRERHVLRLPEGGPVEIVELDSVQLVPPGPGMQARFRMGGLLRFYQVETFDPFCWGPYYTIADAPDWCDGGLRFNNLQLDMRWVGTARPSFVLRDDALTFDTATSPARPDSLVARFPARLQRLIAADATGATPETLGFVNIDAPIRQGALDTRWYGLVYRIDLGSLGALANSAPLTMELIAAWSPAPGDAVAPVYLGIKLPGADIRGISIPLQGLLTLGFKSVEFLVHDPGDAPNSYVLCLRNFAVRLLGLSFPPGRNDIYLFGNPDQAGDQAVGWYAAYAAADDAADRVDHRLRRLQALNPQEPADGN